MGEITERKKGEDKGMLTRRTFMVSAGAVVAATGTTGITVLKPEITEHGLVDIRFSEKPTVIKAAIFSDKRRDVFGIRILEKRGPSDIRLAELPLSVVRAVVGVPGPSARCSLTTWTPDGKKEELLDLKVKDTDLMLASVGQLETSPVWMALADVKRVL